MICTSRWSKGNLSALGFPMRILLMEKNKRTSVWVIFVIVIQYSVDSLPLSKKFNSQWNLILAYEKSYHHNKTLFAWGKIVFPIIWNVIWNGADTSNEQNGFNIAKRQGNDYIVCNLWIQTLVLSVCPQCLLYIINYFSDLITSFFVTIFDALEVLMHDNIAAVPSPAQYRPHPISILFF